MGWDAGKKTARTKAGWKVTCWRREDQRNAGHRERPEYLL
jgi:hypothetical protein